MNLAHQHEHISMKIMQYFANNLLEFASILYTIHWRVGQLHVAPPTLSDSFQNTAK